SRTQEFVAEIPMTMLDVDEGETRLPGAYCRPDEGFDDFFDLRIRETGMAGVDLEFAIEHRVAIENPRLEPIVLIRPGETAGVSELQSHEQVAGRPAPLLVSRDQNATQVLNPSRGLVSPGAVRDDRRLVR